MEIKDIKIHSHVIGVGGSGQWQHSDIERKSKYKLADCPTMALGDLEHLGTRHYFAVAGQQRKALVKHVIGRTELTDEAIPASDGITPILDEARSDACLATQSPELFKGHVADTQHTCSTAVVDHFHGTPGRPIVRSQADSLSWPVQDIRIDELGPQVFKRTGKRLFHLSCDGGSGIVG